MNTHDTPLSQLRIEIAKCLKEVDQQELLEELASSLVGLHKGAGLPSAKYLSAMGSVEVTLKEPRKPKLSNHNIQ